MNYSVIVRHHVNLVVWLLSLTDAGWGKLQSWQ